MEFLDAIKQKFRGEVLDDDNTLTLYSHDTSLFEIRPQAVLYPRDIDDLKSVVDYVSKHKSENPNLSITGRSAGTDMTGGAINDSIVLDFTKYFNHIGQIEKGGTIVEPGVYYRDFEKATLAQNLYVPSYPASKNLCALGGMINNNSGGEKTLVYGKTIDYVDQLKVILCDGNEYTFGSLNKDELDDKMNQTNLEGDIYRQVFKLVDENYDAIKSAKPNVSKNSTGYNIWDVWDRDRGVFDLTKLIIGSQGTLGLTTEIKIRLVETKKYSGLLVIYVDHIDTLPKLVPLIVETKPEAFESFDDHTLKLALRFIPKFVQILGLQSTIGMGFQFAPHLLSFLLHGIPKFTLLVQYEGHTQKEVDDKLATLETAIKNFSLKVIPAHTKKQAERFWVIRRESFNLLRKNVKNKHTAPFIDDLIVRPEFIPEFFPKLKTILEKYDLLYTIAGHMGDGNFHIIPLMDLTKPEERVKIPAAEKEVYELVHQFKGSMSAEHNDGLIRGPYLEQMYGKEVVDYFRKVKTIFDPQNIFNPHKKTDATLEFSNSHIRNHF